jgi:hypothetical protein
LRLKFRALGVAMSGGRSHQRGGQSLQRQPPKDVRRLTITALEDSEFVLIDTRKVAIKLHG